VHEVLEALALHAEEKPDAVAFSDGTREFSFSGLHALTSVVAGQTTNLSDTIGLLASNSVDWIATWLGLARAGKTIVPLPTFFSSQQLSHVIADAGVGSVLTDSTFAPTADALPVSSFQIAEILTSHSGQVDNRGGECRHVIYTSGTTGTPKGVRLGTAQIDWTSKALMHAVDASDKDRYLSVLPYSLLLEQICGICVPVLAGASVHVAGDVARALMSANTDLLIESAVKAKPTISVMVPDFLSAWVGALTASGMKAPASLRYIAVGGAPVSPALVNEARFVGIPVYEGYGLSECCSVVAVNRPGEPGKGTVGRPLEGLQVMVCDGEIHVSGPSVMDGYLHGDEVPDSSWATGDLGETDERGNLVIHGRKDNVLILSSGRNVSPEWVETMIEADPRIEKCVLSGHGMASLHATLTPSESGWNWFDMAGEDDIAAVIQDLCAEVPTYARPGKISISTPNNREGR